MLPMLCTGESKRAKKERVPLAQHGNHALLPAQLPPPLHLLKLKNSKQNVKKAADPGSFFKLYILCIFKYIKYALC